MPDAKVRSATLRRQEASQTAHAFHFVYLIGDALLELVRLSFPTSSVRFPQFVQQSDVLNRNRCLVGKVSTEAICLSVNGRTSML